MDNMNKDNLFDGEGARPYFAKIVYKRLMDGEWFSYADVMADYMQYIAYRAVTTMAS